MRGIASLGGVSTDDPSRGGALPLLPSGSLIEPSRSPLKRGGALQSLFDILAVVACALLVCVTAASLPVALFLLIFASY